SIDYDGLQEIEDALGRTTGCREGWTQYLDLPRQGVPYKKVDLIIRTGETSNVVHDNAYLHGYRGGNTRFLFTPLSLHQYSGDQFVTDLQQFNGQEKRSGQ
ncbi:MAG: hypothetical protein AAB728_01555, partial [Patescibacteria group bacterium]